MADVVRDVEKVGQQKVERVFLDVIHLIHFLRDGDAIMMHRLDYLTWILLTDRRKCEEEKNRERPPYFAVK